MTETYFSFSTPSFSLAVILSDVRAAACVRGNHRPDDSPSNIVLQKVCMRVCVCLRERESECVCVCVCVCV